jgi:tetratricopeptide (TPR) repeat protein
MMKHYMRLDCVRQVLCWLVVSLFLGGLVPSYAADLELEPPKNIQEAVADLLARGSLAQERGELATALQYYREAVESFDRQRPMMAEALLRLADNYREVGAVTSAEEVYTRIVSEFSDQEGVIQKVPSTFRRGSNRGIEMLNAERLSDGAQEGVNPNSSPSYVFGKIDPKQEEMQVVLETAKRRLEKVRSNVEAAHDEVLQAEIRLRVVKNSTSLGLPGSVQPGKDYDSIKEGGLKAASYIQDSKLRDQQLAKVKNQARNWIQSVFIPSLEAEFDAARMIHEEWEFRYDDEFSQYRDLLWKYQYEQEEEAKRLASEKEAAELAKQNERIKISILGKVKSPGFYEVPSTLKVSVMQAIAIAGGFEGNADRRKLQIKRLGEVLRVSLQDEMKKVGGEQFFVESGDTIIVSESLF